MPTPRSVRIWFTAADPTAIIAFVAATVLLTIGGWQILQARDQALTESESRIVTLSRALADQAKHAIEAVDLILIDAVERAKSTSDVATLRVALLQRKMMLPQVRNIVIVGADGNWIIDSADPHAPATSTDRPYFRWHRDHADPDLHIDALLVGRTTGKAGVPLTRRINRPDGSFGGLVVATLAPDYFERFYETVATGAQGTVGMWTSDGHPLFRFPSLQASAPDIISSSAAKAFVNGTSSSHMLSPFDGIERQTAFQRVDGLPLVVSASISTADALANWSRSAAVESAVLVGSALSLILIGLGLQAYRRRLTQLQRESRVTDGRYRLLAENASDLITLNPSFAGPRSYVSPSSRTMVGWEPDQLAVMAIQDFVHPADIGDLKERHSGLTAVHPLARSQYRVRHKAGHYIWIEAVLTLTEAGDVLVAARDITSRRAAERSLAESEARFRSLAEASSDMIQQLDLTGTRLYLSPASLEIFGREPSDMVGTHPADFIVPAEDAARVRALIAEVGAGFCDQARSVHQIRHETGRGVFVEAQFRLVRDRMTGDPREIVSSVRDITERETLQRQNAEANRRLRRAEETAHLGHWRVEFPAGTLTWSDEVFRIHGLDPATYKPKVENAIALYHPDDRVEVERCLAAAVADRQPFEFCMRILRPEGVAHDVLSRGMCEVDARGEVAAVFGTIMDVTDLRAAERAAVASEARYRLLADNATDMITQMDLTGRRLFVSPGSRELLGYSPDVLVDTNPLEMIHPEDANGLRSVLTELASGRRDSALNVNRLRHKDGRWVWVEASIRSLRDTEGQVTGYVAAIRDITNRRLAQEALQASEARYRILAETTTDVITQINTSMQRQYVSPACRHLLGFEPEEMIGLRPSSSIHPDEADAVRALGAKLFAGEVEGDRVITTYRTLHKRGHWVWVEAGMNLVRDPVSGIPVSLICSLRDVTERQEAARQLERARIAAEHATRAKSDFVANMSHELRTPLTGILGIHDLLRRDPTLSAAQRRLVELASEAGTALLGIVNDVLDFSKIEAGQLTIESIPFDLKDLVASCRDLAIGGLNGKPVEVRVKLDPALPRRLIGDPTRLRQVLLNLLTNSIKFTDRGHVEIRLASTVDRSRLRIDVVDTGIGIPADRLETLFNRFTQADTSMTRRYGGTGLGLAISRRLVNLMGGQIGIETRTQSGAHFWFDLPIRVFEGAIEPQGSVLLDQASPRGHHLLLAEDNAINAEIIAKVLETRGFAITIVSDGAAAVKAVASGDRFSLVLMDLQMPVMDGLSATEEIRRREAIDGVSGVPIIGLTANATDDDAARCLAAGMNAHVAKPIAWPHLAATLDRFLEIAASDALGAVENDEPDLNVATLEELAILLGRDKLADYLARFMSDLPTRLMMMMEADPEGLARQAHMLTSTAGQLGFLRLSRLASAIERETRGGSPAHLLSELRAAATRASSAANATSYARAG